MQHNLVDGLDHVTSSDQGGQEEPLRGHPTPTPELGIEKRGN